MQPVVEYRRALHRIPELDDRLPETCAYVHSALASFELEAFSPIPSSVCAYLDAGKAETVAFRADMDALPVEEATGLDFSSENSGAMHACGHDGNTAMALALAEYAAARRAALPRNVLFLFQPSEETTGGAEKLCDTGILERYRAARVFAMHLWPKLEQGRVYCRPGPIMARSNEVTVRFTGKSVYIGRNGKHNMGVFADCGNSVEHFSNLIQIPAYDPENAVHKNVGAVVIGSKNACNKSVKIVIVMNFEILNIYKANLVIDVNIERRTDLNGNNVTLAFFLRLVN